MAEFLAPGHQFHKIKAHKDPLSIQDPLSRYWVLGNQLAILLWRLCPSHGRQKRCRNKKRIQILAPSTFARTKHGRRQKEEPTSKRRRIVCAHARYDDSPEVRALPPSLLTEWRANREALEGPTAKRVKLNTAHRSLVLLQARRTFCCPTALGCRTQTPSPAWQHNKKPLVKPRRRITTAVPVPMRHPLAALARQGPVGPHSHVRVVGLWLSRLHSTREGANVSQMCTTIALALRTCCLNRSGLRPWQTCCEINI